MIEFIGGCVCGLGMGLILYLWRRYQDVLALNGELARALDRRSDEEVQSGDTYQGRAYAAYADPVQTPTETEEEEHEDVPEVRLRARSPVRRSAGRAGVVAVLSGMRVEPRRPRLGPLCIRKGGP